MGTADGFEVEGNLKKKEIHVEITPLLSLSLDNREGLIASIQRRAREEEINGELVGDRDRGDG